MISSPISLQKLTTVVSFLFCNLYLNQMNENDHKYCYKLLSKTTPCFVCPIVKWDLVNIALSQYFCKLLSTDS